MAKACPRETISRTAQKKKASHVSRHKYISPGTLAQLRFSKPSSEILKKILSSSKPKKPDVYVGRNAKKDENLLISYPMDIQKQRNLLSTPKTPASKKPNSRLESLPMDLLVEIMCHLHHDQLKAVFHVSTTVRKAVLSARKIHFNYTTPDRSRQEMLSTVTPSSKDRWPFVSKGHGKSQHMHDPHTPKAPRHGPRPPSRLKFTDMRPVTTVLFPEPSSKWVLPLLQRPLFGSFSSNRTLLYEDELCEAVAQNTFL